MKMKGEGKIEDIKVDMEIEKNGRRKMKGEFKLDRKGKGNDGGRVFEERLNGKIEVIVKKVLRDLLGEEKVI